MPESLKPPLPDVDREYLGVVTLSTGTKVQVHMPTIGDIFGLDLSSIDAPLTLGAVACGMDLAEFKKLSIPDGMLIVSKLSSAIETLGLLGKET